MPEPCPGPCLSYWGPRRMGAASGLLDWWGAGLWGQQAVMLGVPWLRPQAQCRCQACVPQPSLRGVTAGRQRSAVLRSQDHRSPQAARKARISSPNTPPGRGWGGAGAPRCPGRLCRGACWAWQGVQGWASGPDASFGTSSQVTSCPALSQLHHLTLGGLVLRGGWGLLLESCLKVMGLKTSPPYEAIRWL